MLYFVRIMALLVLFLMISIYIVRMALERTIIRMCYSWIVSFFDACCRFYSQIQEL